MMGQNLARNLERNGFSVVGDDADAAKVDDFARVMSGKNGVPARSAAEFLASLESPRRVLIMVPAGKAVDAVINDLKGGLAAGDVLIDGGNTYAVCEPDQSDVLVHLLYDKDTMHVYVTLRHYDGTDTYLLTLSIQTTGLMAVACH